MKKIFGFIMIMLILTTLSFSQESIMYDTLQVNNKIPLFKKPKRTSYFLDMKKDDVFILLEKNNNDFKKIKYLNEKYINTILYINGEYIKNTSKYVKTDINNENENIINLSLINNINTNDMNQPGDELIKFTKQFYTGLSLSCIGTGLIILNTNSDVFDKSDIITYTGIGFSLAGIIVSSISFHHIGKAGILLNENGIGVKIKID